MTANANRGEVTISLDGTEYVLRPSFEAMEAWEEKTGLSSLELAEKADAHSLPLKHVAIVVLECIKAWGRETNQTQFDRFGLDRIKQLIHEQGILKAQPRVAMVLWNALTGGHKPGEVAAAGTTETTNQSTTTDTPAADSPA